MEKITPNERYQDDEIDLYDLWLVLKKRKITVILIVLVSLCAAGFYVVLAPRVYRVSNILVLTQPLELIKQAELIAAIADLDELLKLNKIKAAHLLGIQVGDLNGIGSIKASEIKGSSVLRVNIETLHSSAGIALMEALPQYIQSSPNVASKLGMEKALMEKNRKDLKAIIENPTKDLKLPSNTVVYVPSIDLYTLREKYNLLIMMMEKIEEGQIVTLASKTELPTDPYEPKKSMIVFLCLIMGCLLGIFIAFFMEWVSNAKQARGLE